MVAISVLFEKIRHLLNKRLDYDDVNIIFTKEDIEKI